MIKIRFGVWTTHTLGPEYCSIIQGYYHFLSSLHCFLGNTPNSWLVVHIWSMKPSPLACDLE